MHHSFNIFSEEAMSKRLQYEKHRLDGRRKVSTKDEKEFVKGDLASRWLAQREKQLGVNKEPLQKRRRPYKSARTKRLTISFSEPPSDPVIERGRYQRPQIAKPQTMLLAGFRKEKPNRKKFKHKRSRGIVAWRNPEIPRT